PSPCCCLTEPDVVERTVRDFLTDDIDEIAVDNEAAAKRMKESVGAISKRSERKVHWYQTPPPSSINSRSTPRSIPPSAASSSSSPAPPSSSTKPRPSSPSTSTPAAAAAKATTPSSTPTSSRRGSRPPAPPAQHRRHHHHRLHRHEVPQRPAAGLQTLQRLPPPRQSQNPDPAHLLTRPPGNDPPARPGIPLPLPLHGMPLLQARLVKTPETMSVDIQRAIQRLLAKNRDLHEITLTVSPKVMERLRTEDEKHLADLQRRFEARFTFKTDAALHVEEIPHLRLRHQGRIRPAESR
ncbi:MAG: hypothetical protein HC888_16180, partial [Candidatus Competibacteraceae bacterium]|nr:hypothetical protein [Candidatus Competibacteraceae bacterium]